MIRTPRPGGPESHQAELDELRQLADRFAAEAQATDRAPLVPREHFTALGDLGVYRWVVDAPYTVQWLAAEILAMGCGVTHFVQTQHQSAIGILNRSGNQRLQELLLKPLTDGTRFAGVCFAHVRRAGPPAVTVHQDGDHLVFNGEAPWFTGWGLMDEIMLAGTTPDGRFLSVMTPVEAPGLTASPPMQLAVFTASATVSVGLENFRVEAWRELMTVNPAEMAVADVYITLKNAAQPLGLVHAAGRLLEKARCGWAGEQFVAQALALRERAFAWAAHPGDAEEALAIRASANSLAVRSAQAAVVASGGAANGLDHPAQRLAREAMFYGLPQLTAALKEAELRALLPG